MTIIKEINFENVEPMIKKNVGDTNSNYFYYGPKLLNNLVALIITCIIIFITKIIK